MNNDKTLHILSGSRTGNARSVARLAFDYVTHLGLDVIYSDMQDFDGSILSGIRNMLIVVSTHGEGEPPVQAESFYEFLHGQDAPEPIRMNFAVCGLGDSSYRYYCQTGKDIDRRLEELGGTRLAAMESCDIDFEETAKKWVKNVVEAFKPLLKQVNAPKKKPFIFNLRQEGKSAAYNARILEKKLLTGEGSSKKVLHVRLSIENSGIEYEPGDTLALSGTNSRMFVDELLSALHFDRAHPVPDKDNVRLLKDILVHEYDLTLITPLMIRKYAAIANNKELNARIGDNEKIQAYADRHDILDLVSDYPASMDVEEFLSVLRRLNPRKYSVASSRSHEDGVADITVKVIENKNGGRVRHGVVSSLLWNRLDVGDQVPVELESIPRFRLPADPGTPVIMVCAGTGIAPFRGFLQERKALSAKGMNWLFFGDRNRYTDFLYESDLLQFMEEKVLHRLTTAFSRDQEEPVYVSHKMEEHGQEILDWLELGAILYVCGSKNRLAKSVKNSMVRILQDNGKRTKEEARAIYHALKKNRRYLEEVY